MAPEIPASTTPHLPNGLSTVERDIARACEHARRDRSSVTLIAVSKTFDADAIAPVIAAGQRVFGENRVQEAKAKWPGLISAYPDIALHLIGPLQSNNAGRNCSFSSIPARSRRRRASPQPRRMPSLPAAAKNMACRFPA